MGLVSRVRLRAAGWRPNDRLDADFRCLTTIVRVPEPVGIRIEAALQEIRERWPAHAYYPPESMHITVLNLDPYVAAGEGNAGEAAVIDDASEALTRRRGFRVRLRGLNVSPWTVFAEGYGADRPLSKMRASLRAALQEQTDAPRRDSALRRALPLVLSNVERFTGPVDPEMLRALRPWRDHAFGQFVVREIEIVRTDGFLSAQRTEVLSRLDIRP